MLAAQTKPRDAVSNLAAWVKLVGVENPPAILQSPRVDTFATIAGALLVGLVVYFWRTRSRSTGESQELIDLEEAVPLIRMSLGSDENPFRDDVSTPLSERLRQEYKLGVQLHGNLNIQEVDGRNYARMSDLYKAIEHWRANIRQARSLKNGSSDPYALVVNNATGVNVGFVEARNIGGVALNNVNKVVIGRVRSERD